jgi:hypothetical protein
MSSVTQPVSTTGGVNDICCDAERREFECGRHRVVLERPVGGAIAEFGSQRLTAPGRPLGVPLNFRRQTAGVG